MFPNGLMTASTAQFTAGAAPIFRNNASRFSLAAAEGGSETLKAACWASFSLARLESSGAAPSTMMTSWKASSLVGCANSGAGLLPNLAMWATAVSASMELGRSRRSLPYRCVDSCAAR